MATLLLPLIVFVPLAAAAAVLVLGRWLGRTAAAGMLAPAAFSFAGCLWLFAGLGESPPVWEVPWIPRLDVALRFRADRFGLFFAMLVSGIGALVAA